MKDTGKRSRTATLGLHAGGGKSAAGLKGRAVLVPTSALAALTSLHGPGRYLHGQIKGKDASHKDCVLVKCREDPRLFYFDVGQVQSWLEEQEQGGFCATVDAEIPPGANALQHGQHGEELGQPKKRTHAAHAAGDNASTLRPGHGGPDTRRQRPPIGPPKKGTTKKAEVADLTGREVEVPGSVFNNHLSGLFFRAYIMGPDAAHASAVVLRMLDDPRSRFYFHASEVRDWMRMGHMRAQIDNDSEIDDQDTLDEALAARVLARMSAASSTPPSLSPLTEATLPVSSSPQPTVHDGPGQQGQQVLVPMCETIRHSTPQPMLQWGPTELIAQCPSLLPPSFVQRLLGITSLQDSTAAAIDAAANQMEGQMAQDCTGGPGQQQQEKRWQAHRQQSRRRVGSSIGRARIMKHLLGGC